MVNKKELPGHLSTELPVVFSRVADVQFAYVIKSCELTVATKLVITVILVNESRVSIFTKSK